MKDNLEFNKIRARLADLALSDKAKARAMALCQSLNEQECKTSIDETSQGVAVIQTIGTPPLASMGELKKIIALTEKDAMLVPSQLGTVGDFIYACRRMKGYLKKAETTAAKIAYYGGAFHQLTEVYDDIHRCIRGEMVDSEASSTLRDLRRKIDNSEVAVKAKLETLLRSKKEWFADGYVSIRNGRLVLPVKKEFKNQVSGSVVDTSGSGGTVFIEPTVVKKLQEELSFLKIEEDNEIRRILYTLTALVHDHLFSLKINMDCMETLDFIFAKAKLSVEMKATAPRITTERRIQIVGGRHPLLPQESCVPLEFQIGNGVTGVVITGPNTGGKTVALKTVGLLSMMAQSGLHVSAEEESLFSIHDMILSDIGDGQSISENLSTFSAHITNIIHILKNVTSDSLVLLDELGSGTDPAEGMGLAMAILEELKQKNCLFVATTHYPQIKEYAQKTSRLVNARMAFDRESLQPLYQLQIGEAGESCALYIAQRLGFPPHMLERAQVAAYGCEAVAVPLPTMEEIYQPKHQSKIQKAQPPKVLPPKGEAFQMGDSVLVHPEKQVGIVYKTINQRGEIGVQIKKEKHLVSYKRITLVAAASQMYPEDYDFSIVFDTVENRKARHKMERKYDPSLVIHHEEV